MVLIGASLVMVVVCCDGLAVSDPVRPVRSWFAASVAARRGIRATGITDDLLEDYGARQVGTLGLLPVFRVLDLAGRDRFGVFRRSGPGFFEETILKTGVQFAKYSLVRASPRRCAVITFC
ncbi:hypothetical protein [Rathayibacter toxicus]|uniref:hypothetical protein n=1 Tax=Rathayibacter toxicus TaxID=145458 RepID=UPI000CE90FFC|nr:hypothetical protein [Rathayibacter toxicus]QOD10157.1 hypothetical protein BSG36_09620 [Rathayibacter toxicus]